MKKLLSFCLSFLLLLGIVNAQTTQLFGTTTEGGVANQGTIFKISPDGTGFTTVFNFAEPEGWSPRGNLMQASNGKLYGTCYEGGDYLSCTIYCYDPAADTCYDVYDFDITHGDYPQSGLIEAPGGTLWGAASAGGTDSMGQMIGFGVIYSFDPASNIYTQEYVFTDTATYYPIGSPILVGSKLYGMSNGITLIPGNPGYGALYSFDIVTKTFSTLVQFDSITGGDPEGSLLRAANGKLYGMTSVGGSSNLGTIFSFEPSNNVFQKIFDFDAVQGAYPKSSLMQAANGKLYGVASGGGLNSLGVLFSLDISNGNAYSVLYNFDNSGFSPVGNLSESGLNKLCGTTLMGGTYGVGVIFNFDLSNNAFTPLVNFDTTNGASPNCGLIAASVPTGISALAASKNQVIAYPNPASNELCLKLNNAMPESIRFYDEKGQMVSDIKHPANNRIDISLLAKGAYVAEITVNKITQKVRWVKM
jgi:uncharacterized repeat protein (TIGR03803 family)